MILARPEREGAAALAKRETALRGPFRESVTVPIPLPTVQIQPGKSKSVSPRLPVDPASGTSVAVLVDRLVVVADPGHADLTVIITWQGYGCACRASGDRSAIVQLIDRPILCADLDDLVVYLGNRGTSSVTVTCGFITRPRSAADVG